MTLEDFLPPLRWCQYFNCMQRATERWAGMGFCDEHVRKLRAAATAAADAQTESDG